MGLRFLAAVVLILVLAYLARGWWRRVADRDPGRMPASLNATVQCERCGTYVPRSGAVQRDGAFYCSEQHAAGTEGNDGEV